MEKMNGELDHRDMIELTGKLIVLATILFFFVLIFFFCLHFYTKLFSIRHVQVQTTTTTTRRRRRRLDFAAGHEEIEIIPCSRIGLETSVLKTLPVIKFDPNEFEDVLECAVCLCEVSEGENVRILPICNHGFHVECIDMWFHSHSTCPLCRSSVSNLNHSNSTNTLENIQSTELAPSGEHNQVNSFCICTEEDHDRLCSRVVEISSCSSSSSMASTSGSRDGMVVIDIA